MPRDGRAGWVQFQATLAQLEGGAPEVRLTISDISARKRAEAQRDLTASVFRHAREGILITAADGTILAVNDAFTHITGYPRDEVLGRNPRLLHSGRHDPAFFAALWCDLIVQGYWSGEIWNRRKTGEVYTELLTISAVRDPQGRTQHYVGMFSDISLLKEQERQLLYLAHYDPLTQLPNRVLLADRLHQAMAQSQGSGLLMAVILLDLDDFKAINDEQGHDIGDQLLRQVAAQMQQALRAGDTLARLGGDEFVAVLKDLADIEASMPLLLGLLAAAAQPQVCGAVILQVSASLGVTFYPQADAIDAEQLLRQADLAMYQAKLAGKGGYQVFDAVQGWRLRATHDQLARLRRALEDQELVLYYQPKVNMRTGSVIGAEALIRWQHPEQGLLAPAAFLPVSEDQPLGIEISDWVIATALSQMDTWQAAGLALPVSINIGARQLQEPHFVERLRTRLADHPALAPDSLTLEVLETSALSDLPHAAQVIAACRESGVPCALDDFGTGYASLTYLKHLAVAQLKIDQSFVRNLFDDPENLAILEGVIHLAAAFNCQVIAEGVETLAQGEMLLQLGCELAQGDGIAYPMPAAEIPGWLAGWRPDPRWLGRSAVPPEDLPLLYAGVEHSAWVAACVAFLKGARPVPPPEPFKCRFGAWLASARLADGGLPPALAVSAAVHQAAHALAAELLALQDQGRNPEALGRVDELYALRDRFLAGLAGLLVRRPSADGAHGVQAHGLDTARAP